MSSSARAPEIPVTRRTGGPARGFLEDSVVAGIGDTICGHGHFSAPLLRFVLRTASKLMSPDKAGFNPGSSPVTGPLPNRTHQRHATYKAVGPTLPGRSRQARANGGFHHAGPDQSPAASRLIFRKECRECRTPGLQFFHVAPQEHWPATSQLLQTKRPDHQLQAWPHPL